MKDLVCTLPKPEHEKNKFPAPKCTDPILEKQNLIKKKQEEKLPKKKLF